MSPAAMLLLDLLPLFLLLAPADAGALFTVAKDGMGDFITIREALTSIADQPGRVEIHIKQGIYEEYLNVTRANTTLSGDGIGVTVISSSRSDASGHNIASSGALNIFAIGFVATNLSFVNVAGVQNGRGVALRIDEQHSAFYKCSFEGYQDTLYVRQGSQFFRDCVVTGTIDFIFGDSSAVFQNCLIKVRKPLAGQANVITAQGRRILTDGSGIVLHNCTITVDAGFNPTMAKSYLGRPWKEFSRSVVMQSNIGSFIDPAGWLEKNGTQYIATLVFREYANTGLGAATGGRVEWPGFKVMDKTEALQYTVANFIGGRSWLPETGIPFHPDLL